MCYFLYGAVNGGINTGDYEKTIKDREYHFNCGNIQAVNDCVENCGEDYRITFKLCDCDNAIGQKQADKEQLKSLEKLLLDLQGVRGIKYVLLSKNWSGETNNSQRTVHIQDIDILHFLANIEDNCLYKVELYKKYY